MYSGVISIDGHAQKKAELTAADTSQAFSDALLTLPNKQRPVGALITCETHDIRFWLTGDDPTETSGHVLVAGGSLRLSGQKSVEGFRFCNETSGSNAVLMVTIFF